MDRNRTVEAHFVERPGTVDLDFESDLAYTLSAMGAAAGTYEWETFTAMGAAAHTYAWDRNELDYELDEIGDIQRVYVEKGILDAVELYLVETVLRERHLDWTERSGIYHDIVWEAWQTNLAQAQADLSGQDERIVRTVAGYMTLGDYKSVGCVQKMASLIDAGITLDPDDYDRSTQRYLYWKSDADNDGYTNLEEWQAASPSGELQYAAAYAYEAVNGEPPPPPPEQSQAQAAASECAYCDECGADGDVSVDVLPSPLAGGAIGGEAGGDVDGTEITQGPSATNALLGKEVNVWAEPFTDPGSNPEYGFYFAGWFAPGTMLDYSPFKKDWFMLSVPVDVRATFGRFKLDLPDDNSIYTVNVSPSEQVMVTTGGDGLPELKGSKDAKITLSLTIHDPDYFHNGWERLSQRGPGDPRYSWTKRVTVPLAGYIHPMITMGPADFARQTISLSSNQGGHVLATTAHGWPGSYRYSVTFCPGTPLSFTAAPAEGFEFVKWTCTDDTNPNLVYIDGEGIESVKAIFKEKRRHILDLEVDVTGPAPPGSECPGWITANDPKRFYNHNEWVGLTAHPNPGFRFANWESKDCHTTMGVPLELCENEDVTVKIVQETKVTAVFAPVEVVGVTFQDDKYAPAGKERSVVGMLWHDENWEDDPYGPLPDGSNGVGVPLPHWEKIEFEKKSRPVCVIRQRAPQIAVKLNGSISGGTGCDMRLQGKWTIDGETLTYEQADDVGAGGEIILRVAQDDGQYVKTLPNDILNETAEIQWMLKINGVDWHSPPSTENRFFVILGEPCSPSVAPALFDSWISHHSVSMAPTARRMNLLTDSAKTSHTTEIVADKIARKIGGQTNGAHIGSGTKYWDWVDQGKLECYSGKIVAAAGCLMVGIPRLSIKTRNDDEGCVAYPSTDNNSGPGYNSNCTNMEGPSKMCGISGCTVVGDSPHPKHSGKYKGEPFNNTKHNGFHLHYAGGPGENFFKVLGDSGVWYYQTVVLHKPRVVGSGATGNDADKRGRYEVYEDANPSGGGQSWAQRDFENEVKKTAVDCP